MNERILKVIWRCDSSCLLIKKDYDLKLFSSVKFHYYNLFNNKTVFIRKKRYDIIYVKNEKKYFKENYKARNDGLKNNGNTEQRDLTIKYRRNYDRNLILHPRNNCFNKLHCRYYSTLKDNHYRKENLKDGEELRKRKNNLINDRDKEMEKMETRELCKGDTLKIDTMETKKHICDNKNNRENYKTYKGNESDDNFNEFLFNNKGDFERKPINSTKDEKDKISELNNSNKNEKVGKGDILRSNDENDKTECVNNRNRNNNTETVKEDKEENSKLKKKNEIKKVLNIIFCSSIPMIGFGFMDQFIMIRLGDIFDASIGVSFGISTLCAASFGQLCSDTFGIFFGYVLNYLLQKYKIIEPAKFDIKNKVYQYCTLIGSVLGILLGCSIGMLQLIFIDTSKSERLKKKKELDFIFQMVMCDCPNILNCETSTLFLYDKAKNELWSKAIHGRKNIIKIPANSNEKSFNLWVLRNKEIINCKNVLNNELYNPSHDEKFNFKTRTILAAPILDKNNEVVGVLMFLNKLRSHGGYFTRNDEKLAEMMSKHISIFMEKFNYISEGDKKMIIFDQEKSNFQEEEQDEDEGDEVDTNLSFQREKKEIEEMQTKNIEDEKKKKRKRKGKNKIIPQNIAQIEEDEKIFDEGSENEKQKEYDEEYYDEKSEDDDDYDDEDDEDEDEDDEDGVEGDEDNKIYFENEKKSKHKLNEEENDDELNKLKEEIEKEKIKVDDYSLNRQENKEKNGLKLNKENEDKLNKEEKRIEKSDKKISDLLIENYFVNNSCDSNNNDNDGDNNNNHKNRDKSDVQYDYSNKEYMSGTYFLNGQNENIYDMNDKNYEQDSRKYMNDHIGDKFSFINTNKNSNNDDLKDTELSDINNLNKEKLLLENTSNNNNVADDRNSTKRDYNNRDSNKNNNDCKYNSNMNKDKRNNNIYSGQKIVHSEIQYFPDINECNGYVNSYIMYSVKIIDEFFDNIKKKIFLFNLKNYNENINLFELYKLNHKCDTYISEKMNFENNTDDNTIQEKENMERCRTVREDCLIRNEIDYQKNYSNIMKKKINDNENEDVKKYINNNYKPFLNTNFYNCSFEIIKNINKEVINNYLKNSQKIEKLLFKKKIMLDDVKLYSSNMLDGKCFSHIYFERVFNNVSQKKIDIKTFKMLKNIYKYNLNRIFSNTNKYMIIKKRKKLRKFCYTIKIFDIYKNKEFWFTIFCQNALKNTFYKNLNLIINLHNSCVIDLKLINNYLLNKIYENTSINYFSPNICYNIKHIDFLFKENLYFLNNSRMYDIIYKYIIFYYCRKKVKRKNFNYYNYQDLFIGENFFGHNTHTKKVPKILNDDLGKKSEIITIDR